MGFKSRTISERARLRSGTWHSMLLATTASKVPPPKKRSPVRRRPVRRSGWRHLGGASRFIEHFERSVRERDAPAFGDTIQVLPPQKARTAASARGREPPATSRAGRHPPLPAVSVGAEAALAARRGPSGSRRPGTASPRY